VLSIGLTLSGVLVMVIARLTSFPPVLALQFILGILVAAVNVAVGPILFHIVPKELLGRIAAIINPVLSLSSLFSLALVGYLDSKLLHNFHAQMLGLAFGPIDTILLGSGILATIGGLYAVVNLHGVKIAETKDQGSAEVEQAGTMK
jgi:MFS family permease